MSDHPRPVRRASGPALRPCTTSRPASRRPPMRGALAHGDAVDDGACGHCGGAIVARQPQASDAWLARGLSPEWICAACDAWYSEAKP